MTQPLAGKQILIVEDEPVFRSLLHGWLTSLGATTFQAEDGKDALHKMTEVHPDLMICDISMPRMNGLELVETLRNRGEQLPILMISYRKHGRYSQSVAAWRPGRAVKASKRFRSPARDRLRLSLSRDVQFARGRGRAFI